MFKFFIIILVFLGFFSMQVIFAESLPQFIDLALQKSPLITQSKVQEKISVMKNKDSVSDFLPVVSLSYTPLSLREAVPNAQNLQTSGFMLQATETLPMLGISTYWKYQITKYQKKYDMLAYKQAMNQLIYTVSQDYWNVVTQKKLINKSFKQLQELQQQYIYVKQNYDNGIELQRNVLSFQTVVLRQQEALESMKQQLLMYRKTLYKDVGLQKNVSVDDMDYQDHNVLNDINLPNVKQLYNYQLYKIQYDIGDKTQWLANVGMWPNLELNMDGGYGNIGVKGVTNALSSKKYFNYNVGLTLHWVLFDWGKSWRAGGIAEQTNNLLLTKIQQDINDDYQDLLIFPEKTKSDMRNYKNSNDYFDSSKKSYDLILDQYHKGLATYLDLINSISTYLNGQQEYLLQQNTIQQDILEYHYYKGDINEFVHNTGS